MKLFFFVACLTLASVFAARDPTKVCFPDVFQSNIYSVTAQDYGVVAVDFPNERLGIQYVNSESRLVFNLTDYTGFSVNVTDGSCKRVNLFASIQNVVTQCLPASAVVLANATKIGVPPNSVEIEGWEITLGNGRTRAALTTGSVTVPVLREYRSGTTVEVTLYTNQQTQITDPNIFKVPSVCPGSTVVG